MRCDCRECRRGLRVWRVAGLAAAVVMFLVCAYAFLLMAAAYIGGTEVREVEYHVVPVHPCEIRDIAAHKCVQWRV